MQASPTESVPTVQSNVELFEQVRRQGYSDADLSRVRTAYGLAMVLFAGRMHACGKPYVAHCTGAASALAALDVDPEAVVAEILHGAYRWGDFGPWRVVLRLRRRYLQQQLGARIEDYVYRFSTMPWNAEAILALSTSLHACDAATHTVVAMRLASDLDNTRDRSVLYCADVDLRCVALRRKGPALVDLATQLGYPGLAAALAAGIDETLGSEVPRDLQWALPAGALLAPESATRKISGVLLEQLRRARRWARS